MPTARGRFAQRSAWEFDDEQPITLVCSALPDALRSNMPYADPDNPNYTEMYTLADLDALFELHGHLNRTNPEKQIMVRTTSSLAPEDYATHLVLLGGVDWNPITRELLDRLRQPVRQVSPDGSDPYFEATDGGVHKRYCPKRNGRQLPTEDVAHLFRGPNPFNLETTVTMCNGSFARGTLGAVRTLTDAQLRTRNESYIRSRFGGLEAFNILVRVVILNRRVVTPDLTIPATRLQEFAR